MREAGKMLAIVLKVMREKTVAGMTELELADIAAKELKALGGKPSFLNYNGFPNVICISVNDEVVHGIPGDRALSDGDIVSFDFGVTYKNMVTDSAFSVVVGRGDTQTHQLVSVTEQALKAGIETLHGGVKTGDIGSAIQAVLGLHKYGIVRELVGHGVGHELHEEPDIPNYGEAGTGQELVSGMTIAIEPMANLGTEHIVLDPDGWTVHTADGKKSAHFEHTVLITDSGYEILTEL
jgi:methionyl aminopeptidase